MIAAFCTVVNFISNSKRAKWFKISPVGSCTLILFLFNRIVTTNRKKQIKLNLTPEIIYMSKFSCLLPFVSYLFVAGTCILLVSKGEMNSCVCMHFSFDSFHIFRKVLCKTEFVSVLILADKNKSKYS